MTTPASRAADLPRKDYATEDYAKEDHAKKDYAKMADAKGQGRDRVTAPTPRRAAA
ncbi:hypothetical protein [Streptomyces sp. SID1121]|uniref:hypothetical protein n=1 Tax=Streptomyces sp. SID1121 TaxID=3425888 RepID=UPI0040572AB2